MYLTILDYSNGKTIIELAPKDLQAEEEKDYSDFIDDYILEKYGYSSSNSYWILNSEIEINI